LPCQESLIAVLPQVLLLTSPADFAEARTRLTQDELSITELFRENTPSVVFITNLASRSVHPQLKTDNTTGSSHFDSLLSVHHSMHIVLLHLLFCLKKKKDHNGSLLRRQPGALVFCLSLLLYMHRRDAYTLDMLEIPQGAGSGLIWDMSGHIVTNYHVIRGASELQV